MRLTCLRRPGGHDRANYHCTAPAPCVASSKHTGGHKLQERWSFRIRPPVFPSLIIVILLLGAALLAYTAKTGSPLNYVDERQYFEIARNLSEGRGYSLGGAPTAYRPPAWPALIAVCLYAGLPETFLALLPATLMVGAAIVAANLGRRLSRSPWGGLAGVAILAYPINLYTATTLYPQALATLLLVGLWFTCLCACNDTSRLQPWPYIGSGLIAALLALAVPTLAFTGLVAAGWAIFAARNNRIRAALLALTSFSLPILAWAVRNQIALGSPVLLSTSTGVNLLIGNNPTATGSSGVDVDIDDAKNAAGQLGELNADKYFRDSAVDWIVRHPADSLSLYVAKVLNYFSPYNEPVTATQGTSIQRVIAYISVALLILLVFGRILIRKYLPIDRTELLFLNIFLANSLVMAIFFTRTRFRQPLDNVLLIEAAVFCSFLMGLLYTHQRARRE